MQITSQPPWRTQIPNHLAARSKSSQRRRCVLYLALLLLFFCNADDGLAQKTKPKRSRPPSFSEQQYAGIFFEDAKSVLRGQLPTKEDLQLAAKPQSGSQTEAAKSSTGSDSSDPMAWSKLISTTALEDLIKGSKLRLEKSVTTPAAFAGGGFAVARTEFSLQALLFAIIETHPSDDVRFKKSAAVARDRMTRVASNSKVGSVQTYKEAKQRILDLGDLLNGSTLAGEMRNELDWSKLIDRSPLMKLLRWSNDDYVSKLSASEQTFEANKEELARYAQLIAVLGKVALAEDMPDATDDDYLGFSIEMIKQAQQITLATQTGNADLARQAAARLSQSCQDCHDNFR